MCGRYSFTKSLDQLEVVQPEGIAAIELRPRYNIAPTQYAPVMLQGRPRRAYFMRWGLIPPWAQDSKSAFKMINARAETLLEKKAFAPLVAQQRCVVLADGFYEWKRVDRLKQPYRIRVKGREAFYLAGLWTRWVHPQGQAVYTFTIVTTEPNELMIGIHDRMPAILDRAAAKQWLDPALGAAAVMPLLGPYPAEAMEAYPVDPSVGSVKADHPGLIIPYQSPLEGL